MGNLDAKVNRFAGEVQAHGEKIDRNQSQIVELLTQLTGRNANAS
ncbi:hypothetical protein ACJ6WF_34490 [Streptomyces sp. MMS24-I2-30]